MAEGLQDIFRTLAFHFPHAGCVVNTHDSVIPPRVYKQTSGYGDAEKFIMNSKDKKLRPIIVGNVHACKEKFKVAAYPCVPRYLQY